MSSRIEIRAHRKPWIRDVIAIHVGRITEQNGTCSTEIGEPIVLKTISEEDQCREMPAAMIVTPEEAQQFIDELWRVGIRPTEGAGSVGQLAAVKAHLEDMRTLVFKTESKPSTE